VFSEFCSGVRRSCSDKMVLSAAVMDVFGFVLQFLALGRITAVAAGIVYCAEPVVAAVCSALILNEGLSPLQIAGGALVLSAIVANVLLDQRRLKDRPLVPAD